MGLPLKLEMGDAALPQKKQTRKNILVLLCYPVCTTGVRLIAVTQHNKSVPATACLRTHTGRHMYEAHMPR